MVCVDARCQRHKWGLVVDAQETHFSLTSIATIQCDKLDLDCTVNV